MSSENAARMAVNAIYNAGGNHLGQALGGSFIGSQHNGLSS